MKIRFLSAVPCALTVGGAYCGITDTFDRYAEIRLKDNLFACFSPQNALPLGFFLNERLFFSPPEGVEVYLLRDGASVYAKDFPARSPDVRIVAQERFLSDLVTVYFQGKVYLSIDTDGGFFVQPLSLRYESAEIKKRDGLFFIEGKNALCIFNARGKKLFDEEINGYSYEGDVLKAELPLYGGGRVLRGEWALTDEECFSASKKTFGASDEGLKTYDFFENFRTGVDVMQVLSDELKADGDFLRSFLGDYEHVFPCDDENECGVLRKKGARIFEADYFRAEWKEDKITDLQKL